MVNDSYFRFDDDNKIKYTFSRSSQENWVSWRHTAPYSEYKDNWENCLNLRHTLGIIYLTSILVIQCFQISLHNDDNECYELMILCVCICKIISCFLFLDGTLIISRNFFKLKRWINQILMMKFLEILEANLKIISMRFYILLLTLTLK